MNAQLRIDNNRCCLKPLPWCIDKLLVINFSYTFFILQWEISSISESGRLIYTPLLHFSEQACLNRQIFTLLDKSVNNAVANQPLIAVFIYKEVFWGYLLSIVARRFMLFRS